MLIALAADKKKKRKILLLSAHSFADITTSAGHYENLQAELKLIPASGSLVYRDFSRLVEKEIIILNNLSSGHCPLSNKHSSRSLTNRLLSNLSNLGIPDIIRSEIKL